MNNLYRVRAAVKGMVLKQFGLVLGINYRETDKWCENLMGLKNSERNVN